MKAILASAALAAVLAIAAAAQTQPGAAGAGIVVAQALDGRSFAAAGGDLAALTGAPVYDARDEWVGEIAGFVLGPDGAAWAVVEVGGFLGFGERPVAIDIDDLSIERSGSGATPKVSTGRTLDELYAMPEYTG